MDLVDLVMDLVDLVMDLVDLVGHRKPHSQAAKKREQSWRIQGMNQVPSIKIYSIFLDSRGDENSEIKGRIKRIH